MPHADSNREPTDYKSVALPIGYGPLMPYQSIAINTIKLIPTNNQKIGVNKSFLMPNRIVIITKELIPINIQKIVINVTTF